LFYHVWVKKIIIDGLFTIHWPNIFCC
jgi:hypothetical protein